MVERLIQSLQEAVDYAKGNKGKCRETKIEISQPVEIPDMVDINTDLRPRDR